MSAPPPRVVWGVGAAVVIAAVFSAIALGVVATRKRREVWHGLWPSTALLALGVGFLGVAEMVEAIWYTGGNDGSAAPACAAQALARVLGPALIGAF